MEDAPTLLKIPVRMSRYLDTFTKTQLAKIMVQHGKPSRSPRADPQRETKRHEKTPGERKKNENGSGEKKKKREHLGPPTLRAPSPSGPQPFALLSLSSLLTSLLSLLPLRQPRKCPKLTVAKVGRGQSWKNCWPKSVVATVERTSWPRTLATSSADATTVGRGDKWTVSTSLDVAAFAVVGTSLH